MHRTPLIFHSFRHPILSIAVGPRVSFMILMLLACSTAWGQVSGSVSVVSNYLFRGFSLSEGNPVPQMNLEYDGLAGWYVGAFASRIALDASPSTAQLVAYAGCSRQWLSGLSWETGVTETLYLQDATNNYTEVFAGMASEHFSGRIYFSPDYMGQDLHATYSELNVTYPLWEQFHLLAHVGYLHVPQVSYAEASTHLDTRLGIGAVWSDWNFQLAWVAVERNRVVYTPYRDANHVSNPHTGVASVSYAF